MVFGLNASGGVRFWRKEFFFRRFWIDFEKGASKLSELCIRSFNRVFGPLIQGDLSRSKKHDRIPFPWWNIQMHLAMGSSSPNLPLPIPKPSAIGYHYSIANTNHANFSPYLILEPKTI
jgi:hypothetical protein